MVMLFGEEKGAAFFPACGARRESDLNGFTSEARGTSSLLRERSKWRSTRPALEEAQRRKPEKPSKCGRWRAGLLSFG